MESSLTDSNNDMIPSYEESLKQGASRGPAFESKGESRYYATGSLTQQLSNVRTQRINTILASYIDPLLQSQALAGLCKTTLVLVPSNITALQRSSLSGANDIVEGSGDNIGHDSGEAVVGFPSADYVKLVRLHGEEYVLEFLRQPAVINELDGALKARLKATGHIVTDSSPATVPQSPVVSPTSTESPKPKRGFFSRRAGKPENVPSEPQTPASTSESTWRLPQDETILTGHVRVKVGLQEVCLRVVTEMGLYETRTGKAVVVNMEIGS